MASLSSLGLLFFLGMLGTGLWWRVATKKGWFLDRPNHRSAHTVLTVRGGGFVFASFWIIWMSARVPLAWWGPAALVAVLGFWDDWRSLSGSLRLGLQIIAALMWVITHGQGLWWGAFLLVSAVNVFNFMDGLDGLAGTEAVWILGVGGWLLKEQGAPELALSAWGLSALVLGFLVWNWPKAKLFMGDVGSYLLGFAIGIIALTGYLQVHLSLLYWLMLSAAFWMDVGLTLLRRCWLRQPLMQAHRLHAYQRLQQSGYTHQQVLWVFMGLNAGLAGCTLGGFYHPKSLGLACLGGVLSLIMGMIWVEYRKPLKV